MPTAHPRTNRTKSSEPQRGSTSAIPFFVQPSELWNPIGVRGDSGFLTWGAPQRGDPRLCCETRTGLSHRISHNHWPCPQPQRGFTTKPGVAVPTAHPRKNRIKSSEPQRGSTAIIPFFVQPSELWNPVGVRGDPGFLTWGAPQRGDPRLCCETLSGLKHTISLRKTFRGVATHCPGGILAVGF